VSETIGPIRNDAGDHRAASDASLLDLYLDGQLSGDALRAFEARVAGDPGLQREIAAQREIDGAIVRAFGPSDATTREVPSERAAGRIAPQSVASRFPILRVAAVIAVLVLGAAAYVMTRPMSALAKTYRDTVAAGFVPEVVCTTDEQFAEWTKTAIGIPIVPQGLPASIQLVGWSRSNAMSSYTGVLLAKVDGREVLVFMEGTKLGKKAPLALQGRTDGLHQFESVIPTAFGPMRLIEVTPFDRPQVAPRIALVE
jgi:hypothetical protein